MMQPIDPKYGVDWLDGEVKIIKIATREPIPDDEPLILFRARDHHAIAMLRYYRNLCANDGCTDFHMKGIDNRLSAFEEFAVNHPERMKQPGITKGL